MKIQELMEARMQDALPHLLVSVASLEKLYSQELPSILNDFVRSLGDSPTDDFERGVENRDIRAVRLRIGSTRSKWFTENYFSVSKSRRDLSGTGLKNALAELATLPELQSISHLKALAHLNVNINPNNKVQATMFQRKHGTAPKEADIQSYGELMEKIEASLPTVVEKIGRIIKNPEVSARGEKLRDAIESWYRQKDSLVPRFHQNATNVKMVGGALRGTTKHDANVKQMPTSTRSQNMSAAQEAINRGFELLRKNGVRDHELHTIRQKVQKSDNQLMALMQVFQEFGINPHALMEAWLKTY